MTAPATPWMRRLPRQPPPPPPPPPPAPPQPQPPVPALVPVPAAGLTRLESSVAADPTPLAPRGAALILVPPPGVTGTVTLDPAEPVVRMDALQSGVGGLVIRGADRVAWEDTAERSGVLEPGAPTSVGSSTGDDVPQHGNRSLLRPLDGTVVVTLRHVRALRRLLIDAPANTVVTLTPYCAGVVRAADPAARLRLSVVVVEGRLEIRAEYGLPDPWREALTAMGWSPLASIPRATPDLWQ